LYDGYHAVGTVIEQNPYPNAVVKKGRRVYLSVSIGEEPIKVPDLFGKSFVNAKLILKSYNLNCYPIYQYSDQYPADVIVGQYPDVGVPIKPGGRISVNVSLGKKKAGMVVPNFIDKSLYEVKEQVAQLGIRLGNVRYEKRDNILPETVLSQSIKPGTLLEPNMVIDLVVSKIE
jgi:serine/threonine-protein kinase